LKAKSKEALREFSNCTPNDWVERNIYVRYPILGIKIVVVPVVARDLRAPSKRGGGIVSTVRNTRASRKTNSSRNHCDASTRCSPKA
jgi:hypothetical protein